MGRRRRNRKEASAFEDSIETWGGEDWFVVDHTSGGAPIGIRLAELERDAAYLPTREPERDRVRRLLGNAFFGETPEVVRIRCRRHGRSRSGWTASVKGVTAPGAYIVLVPDSEAGPGFASRVRRECRILGDLAHRKGLPFRVPRPVALLEDGGDRVLIETVLVGSPATSPNVLGAVAAAVHRIDVDVDGPATRREVALAAIEEIERADSDERLLKRALKFARRSLPQDGPSCFTHGDLAENVLTGWGEALPAIIDFQRAGRGDPAQDLASITCGDSRPFGVADGCQRLLSAYQSAGGLPVTLSDIRFYEVLLLAGIVARSWTSGDERPDTSDLAGLLNRIQCNAK